MSSDVIKKENSEEENKLIESAAQELAIIFSQTITDKSEDIYKNNYKKHD